MITAKLVSEVARNTFLPSKFPGHSYLLFESGAYNTLSTIAKEYLGGYWQFYDLSNGGVYIAPTHPERFTLDVASNGYTGTVSADAAGIIASLFSINALCWKYHTDEIYSNLYYQLRDFAAQHVEASAIYGAID